MSRLVLMGSGETAPSLVPVHRKLLSSLGQPRACWFDTPYGFQENAAILSAKTVDFFRDSLATGLRIASLPAQDSSEREKQAAYQVAQSSNYLVSGPGSPSYVLDVWKSSAVPSVFLEKLRRGDNVVVFASAAACAVGALSLPVYEIYKVGQKPHWREGLDLLGSLGFRAVVLPHFNNTVGGNHDTRFCYMGERRLALLEQQMDDDLWVWGVDEHTAVVLDLAQDCFEVRGKGGLSLRRRGRTSHYPSGFAGALSLLRHPRDEGRVDEEFEPPQRPALDAVSQGLITELVRPHQEAFRLALAEGNGSAAAEQMLLFEGVLEEWSGDSDTHHRQLARASFRQMVEELGMAAGPPAPDLAELVRPLVEALIELRATARAEGRYDLSDRIRSTLESAGVEVRDSRDGVSWTLRARDGGSARAVSAR